MQAMKDRDDEIPLVDHIQIDDAYWGGVRRGVRGRGAKGKRPLLQQFQSIKKVIRLLCILAL